MPRYVVKHGELYLTDADTLSPNQKDAEVFDDKVFAFGEGEEIESLVEEPGIAKYSASIRAVGFAGARVVKLVPKRVKQ